MRNHKITVFTLLLTCLIFMALPLHAQQQKLIKSYDIPSDSNNLMGDTVDIDTGRLSLFVVDVSLPGNSDLPVQFGRRMSADSQYSEDRSLRNWEVDTPKITGISKGGTCEKPWGGRQEGRRHLAISLISGEKQIYNEWAGVKLRLPDGSTRQYVPIDSSRKTEFPSHALFATDNQWIVYCGTTKDHIIAESPVGVKYHFRISYHGFSPRTKGEALLSKVQDRYNNWVKYEKGRIYSDDGREITIEYDSRDRISTVTANGRKWKYEYSGYGLSKVTLPDGRFWLYGNTKSFTYDDLAEECPKNITDLSVKSPSGTTASYEFRVIHNGLLNARKSRRSDFPKGEKLGDRHPPYYSDTVKCGFADVDDNVYPNPRVNFTVAVIKKTLSGPNIPDYVWSYDYEEDAGSFDKVSSSLLRTKKRTVTDPLGNRTVSYINRVQSTMREGIVEREELFAPGASIPLEVREYRYEAGMHYGLPLNKKHLRRVGTIKNLATKIITIGNDKFTTLFRDFEHGKPTTTEFVASDGTLSRTEKVTFKHVKSNVWLLWLPELKTINNKVFDEYIYNDKHRVKQHNKFGYLYETFGYHKNGTQGGGLLAWKENALGERTTYGFYHRGKPQKTVRPGGNATHLDIDSSGWVKSEVDARGNTTWYEYNSIGWLTKINRHTPWSDTIITYPLDESGAQLQDVKRGAKQTITKYDAFYRPVRVTSRALSGGGLTAHIDRRYDAHNRLTFESFPSTKGTPTDGTITKYDALGRVVLKKQNVAPFAVTSFDYLDGNITVKTDPEGNQTSTEFRSFGSPKNREITSIRQPEGVSTSLSYDIYGNLEEVRQFGSYRPPGVRRPVLLSQSQTYIYDERLRLCRHSVLEIGDTLYAYDEAGRQTGIAYGQPKGYDCANLPASAKITRRYDELGRVVYIDYPSVTPDTEIEYDPNGNVVKNTRGTAEWRYVYNDQDQLTEETLRIDGRTYPTEYKYTNDGYLRYQRTAGGLNIYNGLNGLGQTTRLGVCGLEDHPCTDFVYNMSYHANGQLAKANYYHVPGGDFTQTIKFNARQLVSSIFVKNTAGLKAIDLSYSYDKNGRITKETNGAVSGENRSYRYDDLGRLTKMDGPWGVGSADYDIFGNLRKKTLGSRSVEMRYFGTRVASFKDSAGSNNWMTFDYDDRGNVTDNKRVTLSYDAANQPTSMSGNARGSFVYDGNLKRVKQTVNGKTIYSVYSQSGAILYRDNISDNKRTEYLRSAGKTMIRVVNGVSTGITYPYQNHLGSAIAASKFDSDTIVWRESYTPYGEKRIKPAANRDNEGFTGHIDDSASGLTYMQARYYDPVVGRFLSNDPVGFAPSRIEYFNRYVYAGNDPVNFKDPDGKAKRRGDTGATLGLLVLHVAGVIDEGTFNQMQGRPKDKSKAKRRASRSAQRKKNNPKVATSQSGKNVQGKSNKENLRGQIKTGMDGKTKIGVQDGSKDKNNNDSDHKAAVDVGNMKEGGHPKLNKNGGPNISNEGKVKSDIKMKEDD